MTDTITQDDYWGFLAMDNRPIKRAPVKMGVLHIGRGTIQGDAQAVEHLKARLDTTYRGLSCDTGMRKPEEHEIGGHEVPGMVSHD